MRKEEEHGPKDVLRTFSSTFMNSSSVRCSFAIVHLPGVDTDDHMAGNLMCPYSEGRSQSRRHISQALRNWWLRNVHMSQYQHFPLSSFPSTLFCWLRFCEVRDLFTLSAAAVASSRGMC